MIPQKSLKNPWKSFTQPTCNRRTVCHFTIGEYWALLFQEERDYRYCQFVAVHHNDYDFTETTTMRKRREISLMCGFSKIIPRKMRRWQLYPQRVSKTHNIWPLRSPDISVCEFYRGSIWRQRFTALTSREIRFRGKGKWNPFDRPFSLPPKVMDDLSSSRWIFCPIKRLTHVRYNFVCVNTF